MFMSSFQTKITRHYEKARKSQSEEAKISSELNSDVSQMLEVTYRKFKIIMLSMLMALVKM